MNIGFENVNRPISPRTTGMDFGTSATGASAPGKAKGDWTAREAGADELAKVAGEETVDEAALRRDDDLGKLVSKAFDPAAAAAALPPLGIGG